MDSYALGYKERSLRFSTLGTRHLHFATKSPPTKLVEEQESIPSVIETEKDAEIKDEHNSETPKDKDNSSEENSDDKDKESSEIKSENTIEKSKNSIEEDITGNNESP